MKNLSVLQAIEQEKKIKIPEELINFYSLLSDLDASNRYVLNMRKMVKHWFLDYNYFMVSPWDVNDPGNAGFFIKDIRSKFDNLLAAVNDEVQDSVNYEWKKKSVFVFAWCNEIVEKDTSLFYVFDEQGNSEGIYAYSLNWVEDIVFVAKNLADLFYLDKEHLEKDVSQKVENKVLLTRSLGVDKNLVKDYKELLSPGSYELVDAEFGVAMMNLEVYKRFIDTRLMPLSGGLLRYDSLEDLSDDKTTLELKWSVDGRSQVVKLDSDTDYLDAKFFPFLNKVLLDCGVKDHRFVPFGESKHEQVFTLAFVKLSVIKKLKKIWNVELMDH